MDGSSLAADLLRERILIDGRWIDAREGRRFAITDPANTALETFKTDASKKEKEATAAREQENAKAEKARKYRRKLERAALRFFASDDEEEDEEKMDAKLDAMDDRALMIAVIQKTDAKFDGKTAFALKVRS